MGGRHCGKSAVVAETFVNERITLAVFEFSAFKISAFDLLISAFQCFSVSAFNFCFLLSKFQLLICDLRPLNSGFDLAAFLISDLIWLLSQFLF